MKNLKQGVYGKGQYPIKRYVGATAAGVAAVAAIFYLKSCGPQHETIVQIKPAKEACHCGEIPVADTSRITGKKADTLVVTPGCKDTTTPAPPKPQPKCGAHSHVTKKGDCGCDKGYHNASKKGLKCEKNAPAEAAVEQPKPAGCVSCPESIESPHSPGAQVRKSISTAIGAAANTIKNTFAEGAPVVIVVSYTDGPDGYISKASYSVLKGSEDVTGKGNLASITGVNLLGQFVGSAGSCCTRTFRVAVP